MFPIAGFSCLNDEKWPLISQRGIDLDEHLQLKETELLVQNMSGIFTLFFCFFFYTTLLSEFLG